MDGSAPTNPPAGWYHDSRDSSAMRWWDGHKWTEHVQAPQPQLQPEPQPPRATGVQATGTVLGAIGALIGLTTTPRPGIVCQYCLCAGAIRARRITVKDGISGGKATGAILTGGISLFATGLSRERKVWELSCHNCGMTYRAG